MIISKIKIHYLTYFFIFISCITGMFKNIVFLSLIIIVHEIGHILIIKYYKYEIDEVLFLPFGGMTKITKDINSPIKEELLIALGGILSQFIFFYFIFAFFYSGFINIVDFLIIKKYSIAIILFNLLPIIPLDGSIVSKCILEYIFPYKLAYQLNIIISFIFVIIFFLFNYFYQLNNYLIISFLLYKIITEIKHLKYYYNKFLLERFLKNIKGYKLRLLKYDDIHRMKKENKHYFYYKNKFLTEKDRLNKLFDNKN